MMESCPHVEISAQKGGGTPVNSRKKTRKKGGIVLAVLLLLIAVAGFEVVQVYAQISDAQAQEQALSVQLEQQKLANAALRDDLARADDEEFVKELARQQLGLAEPGERIFYDVNN